MNTPTCAEEINYNWSLVGITYATEYKLIYEFQENLDGEIVHIINYYDITDQLINPSALSTTG